MNEIIELHLKFALNLFEIIPFYPFALVSAMTLNICIIFFVNDFKVFTTCVDVEATGHEIWHQSWYGCIVHKTSPHLKQPFHVPPEDGRGIKRNGHLNR